MKTLKNQTLFYDEDCPLCSVYTTGFVKAGMLDEDGKKPFSELSDEDLQIIDLQRASNEIALVDNKNKTVVYGIDSLLMVIGNSFPLLEKAARIRPINYLLKKLYSFISYNRKVIIPNRNAAKAISCIPDFNYRYRLLYIILAIAVTTLTLYCYAELITVLSNAELSRELIIISAQIPFQCLFIMQFHRKAILNYTGHLMTVSLLGSLLLIPVLILSQLVLLPKTFILGWFGLSIIIMFAEHFRRIKILGLPVYLCYTWVLYRIITALLLLSNL